MSNMLCWQVRKGGNSKGKGKRILIYIGVILVPQQFPQLDHMATCEWWNCGPTWNHYFFSTTYTLPHRQVVAKVVKIVLVVDLLSILVLDFK